MNKERRKIIASVNEKLGEIIALLEEVTEAEREAFENMPEGLQSSERGELMESAIDTLETKEIYTNVDRRCECWKCELNGKCVYKDKYQRIGRDIGGLGKCAKLVENGGKLQY